MNQNNFNSCDWLNFFSVDFALEGSSLQLFLEKKEIQYSLFILQLLSIIILLFAIFYFSFVKFKRKPLKEFIEISIFKFLDDAIQDLKNNDEEDVMNSTEKNGNALALKEISAFDIDRQNLNSINKSPAYQEEEEKEEIYIYDRSNNSGKIKGYQDQSKDKFVFLQKHKISTDYQKTTYICNFSECCLECLPVKVKDFINNRLILRWSNLMKIIGYPFRRNSKICVYFFNLCLLGCFTY